MRKTVWGMIEVRTLRGQLVFRPPMATMPRLRRNPPVDVALGSPMSKIGSTGQGFLKTTRPCSNLHHPNFIQNILRRHFRPFLYHPN